MPKLFKLLVAVFTLVGLPVTTAQAAEEPLLVISGNVSKLDVDGFVKLTRGQLEAMPTTSFSTTTIWTEGEHEFTGVSLKVLMDEVGAQGSMLKATALNDYSVDVPLSDAVEGGPIIAYLMDGMPMSVREKGPLWLLYPYNSKADYRTETIYSRSIWQLNRIEVVK